MIFFLIQFGLIAVIGVVVLWAVARASAIVRPALGLEPEDESERITLTWDSMAALGITIAVAVGVAALIYLYGPEWARKTFTYERTSLFGGTRTRHFSVCCSVGAVCMAQYAGVHWLVRNRHSLHSKLRNRGYTREIRQVFQQLEMLAEQFPFERFAIRLKTGETLSVQGPEQIAVGTLGPGIQVRDTAGQEIAFFLPDDVEDIVLTGRPLGG